MARKSCFNCTEVVSIRMEKEMLQLLNDIAALQSINTGRRVSAAELIRNALNYVYTDNEILREAFKKSRSHVTKRFK